MLKNLKRYAEAENLYLKAFKIYPQSFHYCYALVLKETGKVNEAEGQF